MGFSELKPGDMVTIGGADVMVSNVELDLWGNLPLGYNNLGLSERMSCPPYGTTTTLGVVFDRTVSKPSWTSKGVVAVTFGNETKDFQLLSIATSGDIVTLTVWALPPTGDVPDFDFAALNKI